MSKSFATLIDEIQQELQDTSGGTWADPEVTTQLEDAIREISNYVQYEMMEVFKIESRTGSADENKADALVDDGTDQFLSTDVGKEVYNKDDRTWAIVTAFVDTGELTLSWDAFPDGDESYAMFNKGCRNDKQINIEDVTDFVDPPKHGVTKGYVYHAGENRNFTIEGDILTVKKDIVDDSADSDADVDVLVWFKKKHRVSQLADLAGTVDGTPSAGATTFTIAAVGSGSDVIAEDTLFTVANVRGTYRIKYDLTLSGGGGTIVFWPGLESAPSSGAIVAFVGSTLTTGLERLVVELTACKAGLSKAMGRVVQGVADLTTGRALINEVSKGGPGVPGRYSEYARTEFGADNQYRSSIRDKLAIVLNELEILKRSRKPVSKHIWPTD